MGNWPSIPLPARDLVASYLSVFDIQNVMAANRALRVSLSQDRPLWVKRAAYFYEMDPILFEELGRPDDFETEDLGWKVGFSYTTLSRTLLNISSHANNPDLNAPTEETLALPNRVRNLSVDQVAGRVALEFEHSVIKIYDLENLSAEPLRSIVPNPRSKQILLHGAMVFMRRPNEPDLYHCDIYNWRVDVNMASLEPPYEDARAIPLRASKNFLIAFDRGRHSALAYSLSAVGYSVEPTVIKWCSETCFIDHQIHNDTLLCLGTRYGSYFYFDVHIPSGEYRRHFLVASPVDFHFPRLAFPFVLVTQRPIMSPVDAGDFNIFGARILVSDCRTRCGYRRYLMAEYKVPSSSSNDQFIFLVNTQNRTIDVVYNGYPGPIFAKVDSLPIRCQLNAPVASYGLSYVFVTGNQLKIRRFSRFSD